MSNIGEAIGWKFNHQSGMSTSDGVITAFPGGIPTQAEQDLWTAEYEAHVQANAYKGKRLAEYAKLNQYEMMFDDQRDSTTTWVDAVNAIKAKYPKPS
jgi:hypothetical protein